ncbi:MAG: enoyl-CoA hydratase/isomerase family protein [Syntrophales bacterium LBB04]|nr:enoyl-CoA hydratase/isomerase family protein [Syntrophales bacterium LBB04]
MIYNTIIEEKRRGYAIITMNRPREMNALSREMCRELRFCFSELSDNANISAVIVTGGDYIFSAGMDIKEMTALTTDEIDDYFKSISQFLKQIHAFNKPVIAAVGGIALGGGFNLATVCDMIIASESAIFSHPELKFGLNPLFSPLRELVGMAKAKEIAMLGEPIGAKEALRIGLVNKVAALDKFMSEAIIMAEELSHRSIRAIEAVKKISHLSPQLDAATALDIEFGMTALLFSRTERHEHMSEFLDKQQKKNKSI